MNKKDGKFKKMSVAVFAILMFSMFAGFVNVSSASVIETVPANGAAKVAVNTVITVTFPQEMDSATINNTTFFVQTGTAYGYTNVAGTVTYNAQTATFTPAALSYGVTYKVTITKDVKTAANESLMEADHTFSFTTETSSSNVVMPVVSNVPAANATNVDVNTEISITFSEEMNSANITGNTFYVRTGSGYDAANVDGTVTYSDKVAKFTPASALSKKTAYTVTLVKYVKTAAGSQMSSDHIFSFVTAEGDTPPPQDNAPEVSSVSPASGATNVSVNKAITATFTEDMNPATLTECFYC